MVPIPVFWTEYTTTMHGSALKFVPCENCSTEYVYVLKREGTGGGTSFYMLNDEGASHLAATTAKDSLQSALENDFDPVPCPVCGHYQRFMFPKLLKTKGLWGPALMLLVLLIGCLEGVNALYWTAAYWHRPNDHAFGKMGTAWSVLVLVCLFGLGVLILKQFKIRNFDPNREDQQARITIGRTRAVTRAEYERGRQGIPGSAAGA